VTRAAHQAEELAGPLRELGAKVILLPVIDIAPPSDPERLRRAAADCASYNWIVFTSANGVEAFTRELSGNPSELSARIAVVGAATREAAERKGFRVNVTPERYVAESLVEALGPEELNGVRILIPSAAVTREAIAPELRKRGAQVDVVEAYRNVLPSDTEALARATFQEPYPDWVLFASSSAVDNLLRLVGVEALCRTKIASIGPVTSSTIRKHGLEPNVEAEPHTVQGLVSAVSSFKAGE
jgi:uroporphyrinogen-III synthase